LFLGFVFTNNVKKKSIGNTDRLIQSNPQTNIKKQWRPIGRQMFTCSFGQVAPLHCLTFQKYRFFTKKQIIHPQKNSKP